MMATVTDERRRLVMPQELPAGSAVTIQQVEADAWLVKKLTEDKDKDSSPAPRCVWASLVQENGRWIFSTPVPLQENDIAAAVEEERGSR